MFRRRRKGGTGTGDGTGESADEGTVDSAAGTAGGDAATDAAGAGQDARPADRGSAAGAGGGPYDDSSVPDDGVPRLDLGALRVPMIQPLEVRIDIDQATGALGQVVLADGDSLMQLGAFAAPRSGGLWADVRAEIATSITAAGGSSTEVDGPWGVELHAQVPAGPGQLAPARFVGVDRPRFFVRALLSGPAAVDAAAAARLEEVLRGLVVVRGPDALPLREPLPVRLPPEAQAAMPGGEDGAQRPPSQGDFGPGQQVSETR